MLAVSRNNLRKEVGSLVRSQSKRSHQVSGFSPVTCNCMVGSHIFKWVSPPMSREEANYSWARKPSLNFLPTGTEVAPWTWAPRRRKGIWGFEWKRIMSLNHSSCVQLINKSYHTILKTSVHFYEKVWCVFIRKLDVAQQEFSSEWWLTGIQDASVLWCCHLNMELPWWLWWGAETKEDTHQLFPASTQQDTYAHGPFVPTNVKESWEIQYSVLLHSFLYMWKLRLTEVKLPKVIWT